MRMGKTDFTFTIVIMVTILGVFFMYVMEDAEGAASESIYNETNTYWNDYNGNQKFTHTKDDYIVTAYSDDDENLMVAYRESGGSWEYAEVCPFDFAGATMWKPGSIINTENNSLVLMAGGYVSSYYRIYYFTKFAGSDWDTWDPLLYLYQGSVSYYIGDHAINDTGVILGMCRKSVGNSWTYRLFDFETYTLGGIDTGTTWETGAGSHVGFQIEANITGKFWISWKDTDNKYYIMDFEKDLAQVLIHPDVKYLLQTFAFLDNGVCVAAGAYDYGTSEWPMYYHQEIPGDPFIAIRLDPIWSRSWNTQIQIVVRQGSSVPIITAYSETDEVLYTYAAQWDAIEEVWQNSVHDTGISSTDEYFLHGASNSLWPSHETSGINWTRLKSGWAITAENDENDPDEFMLINDGAVWNVDLTTDDPEITTESLPDATYGVFWSHTLAKTGGTIPFVWMALIKPDWMSIGATNGTLYGTPDETGSETIRVRLADAVPRYHEREWILTVKTSTIHEPEVVPGYSDILIRSLWMLLASISVAVMVVRVITGRRVR